MDPSEDLEVVVNHADNAQHAIPLATADDPEAASSLLSDCGLRQRDHREPKVLGFILGKKNSVPTEIDEIRKNPNEFRI
jgi:hypothetical protein